MNTKDNQSTCHSDSRRRFLTRSGSAVAAGTALSTLELSRPVHAAGSDLLRLGLVGCGGRGTGAAAQALTSDPQTRLTAVADAFAEPMYSSLETLSRQERIADQVTVEPQNRFCGFEGYRRLIESDVDIVLLCTPHHFLPMLLRAAIVS